MASGVGAATALTRRESGAPNPQGKAALPLLGELQAWRDVATNASTPEQVMVSYLCSLLVLSSEFSFKPVPCTDYHLYYRAERWSLSLIAPQEWRPARWREYAGRCQLQRDATWRITPAADMAGNKPLCDALIAFEEAFRERFLTADNVADDLPHYEAALPYHRRVLASALASAVARSLGQLGLGHASGRELLPRLTGLQAIAPPTTVGEAHPGAYRACPVGAP